MLSSTVSQLRCPALGHDGEICAGTLSILEKGKPAAAAPVREIRTGTLGCDQCQTQFPILAGVALLVSDVGSYILNHVKGIAALVSDDEIPIEYREDFIEAKGELAPEHIEEDLEAERVVSLYLMNHYLRVGAESSGLPRWFRPDAGAGSPLIEGLIREHWDRGPFSKISEWVKSLAASSVIELGSGVGGLYGVLKPWIQSYLGVDSSFASVALARHLALGAPYDRKIRVPGDLLQGAVSREVGDLAATAPGDLGGSADFVVGEIEALPVVQGSWDLTIALNAIDMMPEPALLPSLQYSLLKSQGVAIQSCPYIWHEQVSRELREKIPASVKDSAQAVEWLYSQAGFKIEEKVDHLPWLFFKHLRQLEIYSVHIFRARKS